MFKLFLLNKSNAQPTTAMIIPMILLADVFVLKNTAPLNMTKIGVKEFRVPAKELSIFSSATQNKKAGNKLPKSPDRKIVPILFEGSCFQYLML